jgi:hypothetical protein
MLGGLSQATVLKKQMEARLCRAEPYLKAKKLGDTVRCLFKKEGRTVHAPASGVAWDSPPVINQYAAMLLCFWDPQDRLTRLRRRG